MKRSVRVVAFLALAAGCRRFREDSRASVVPKREALRPLTDSRYADVKLNDDADALLRVAECVQVARIHPGYIQALQPTPKSNLEMDASAVDCLVDCATGELGCYEARRLAKVLLDKDTCDFIQRGDYSGIFSPTAAFRVRAGDNRVLILWDAEHNLLCARNGESLGVGIEDDVGWDAVNVAPGRARIIALLREFLPDDAVLRTLPGVSSTDPELGSLRSLHGSRNPSPESGQPQGDPK